MIAIATLGGVQASAQPWEYVYGGNYNERGYDVKPLRRCDSSGYIAVGRTNSEGNDSISGSLVSDDVYVVRTAANGTRVWERYYDFQTGRTDEAHAVIELSDSTGYIVAGSTTDPMNPLCDAFLMKLNCDGTLGWVLRYNPGLIDAAVDVVEATRGNGITTNPGDLLVCGTSQVAGGSYDGLVFRVNATTGAVIWSSRILLGGAASTTSEVFHELIEITGSVGAGDVVAVGGANMGGSTGLQGYLARLNGNSGAIGVAPQGLALYGGANTESFESVRELSIANEATHLVMCGFTTTPTGGGTSDIYLVKTQANPCLMLAQGVVDNGAPGFNGRYNEQARDIIEVTANGMFPNQSFAVGDLALTGFVEMKLVPQPPSPDRRIVEMLLLPVSVANLTGLQGRIFGDFAGNPDDTIYAGREEGFALLGESDGFVLCGYSASNLETDTFPDPEDLYIVRTAVYGQTDCYDLWTSLNDEPSWTGSCPTATINTTNPTITTGIKKDEYESPNSVCPRPDTCRFCKPVIPGSSDVVPTMGRSLRLRTTPNPITQGSRLHVEIDGTVLSSIEIVVHDLSGQHVFGSTVRAAGGHAVVDIPSDGWAVGTYTVTVFDKGQGITTNVMIVR